MKNILPIIISYVACIPAIGKDIDIPDYNIQPVDFTQVNVCDNFWKAKIDSNRTVTIPIAIHQCEITGRIDNFKVA